MTARSEGPGRPGSDVRAVEPPPVPLKRPIYVIRIFFENRSSAFIWTFCVLFVLVLLAVDYVTGPRPNSSLLGLVPIVVITATIGMWAGIALSVACTAGSFVVEAVKDLTSSTYIAAAVMLVTFIAFVMLVTRLKEAVLREEYLSNTDVLTGLYNRRYFNESAESELSRCRVEGKGLALAFIDLDDFKSVNDVSGHDAGDDLLCIAAGVFARHLASIGMIARVGGDEFALLVPGGKTDDLERRLEELKAEFAEKMGENGWSVSLSMGVVAYNRPPPSLDDMMSRADSLMYSAKHGGKNDVRFSVVDETNGERMVPHGWRSR